MRIKIDKEFKLICSNLNGKLWCHSYADEVDLLHNDMNDMLIDDNFSINNYKNSRYEPVYSISSITSKFMNTKLYLLSEPLIHILNYGICGGILIILIFIFLICGIENADKICAIGLLFIGCICIALYFYYRTVIVIDCNGKFINLMSGKTNINGGRLIGSMPINYVEGDNL